MGCAKNVRTALSRGVKYLSTLAGVVFLHSIGTEIQALWYMKCSGGQIDIVN